MAFSLRARARTWDTPEVLALWEGIPMYDGFFGLVRRPFGAMPQAVSYVPTATMENARATLARCIQRGEGAGLVIGPSGTGKSLLGLLLAEQFRRSYQVVTLASGRLSSRRALFQAILYELGRPYRGMDEGELRLAVIDHLTFGNATACGMVLLVDEAHTLPIRLLDEVRLLTNLAQAGQPLVRLVLAGGPSLEERLANPKLDSFSQRLTARCYLEALNRTETKDYIQSQLTAAGGAGETIFPEAACQSVFQATGGVPRLINQVCDHALLLASVGGAKSIEPATVEEAWADLQQLPTPWNAPAKEEAAAGVIEFGSLDDANDAEQPAEAAPTETAPAEPMFRVASVEEDETAEVVASNEAEASHQIHRIERLLAEADDDFQPAGTIGPEVELRFEPVPHPFLEEYEHEEVVTDRYAGQVRTPKPATATPTVETPAATTPVVQTPAPRPTAAEPAAETTKRREYRQLFAHLLRGGTS